MYYVLCRVLGIPCVDRADTSSALLRLSVSYSLQTCSKIYQKEAMKYSLKLGYLDQINTGLITGPETKMSIIHQRLLPTYLTCCGC